MNRRRREEIQRLASIGHLTDWGKPVSANTVDRILELKAELEELLRVYKGEKP